MSNPCADLVYCWGFFWENGEKAHLEFPFGPTHPDNIITDLEDPWMLRAYEHYPNLRAKIEEVQEEWSFAFVIVNPPEPRGPDV